MVQRPNRSDTEYAAGRERASQGRGQSTACAVLLLSLCLQPGWQANNLAVSGFRTKTPRFGPTVAPKWDENMPSEHEEGKIVETSQLIFPVNHSIQRRKGEVRFQIGSPTCFSSWGSNRLTDRHGPRNEHRKFHGPAALLKRSEFGTASGPATGFWINLQFVLAGSLGYSRRSL